MLYEIKQRWTDYYSSLYKDSSDGDETMISRIFCIQKFKELYVKSKRIRVQG